MEGVDYAVSIQERLRQKCLSRFGQEIEVGRCYELLAVIFKLEKNGVPQCGTAPRPAFVAEHNPEYYSTCNSVDLTITQYVLPVLQLMCLFGNVLNLLIYRLPYFDGSSSVHFLRAKAFANLVFVESRIFEVIHAWTFVPVSPFEGFYWTTRPFVIAIANISGTVSTWMTLFVSIETVICVLLPFSFRQYCTRRKTLTLLIASVILSTTLHLAFLCMQTVVASFSIDVPSFGVMPTDPSETKCWLPVVRYSMQRSSPGNELYEKLYFWATAALSIVIPTCAMLLCAVLIVTQFMNKDLGEAFSQRRKCVIRLTVATTLSHLLLEGPALLTFGAAAIKGASSEQHNLAMCVINHMCNLLSVVNATIPFFVFLACNQQFRQMCIVYLKAQAECNETKKQVLLAQAVGRCRNGRDNNERSYVEQTLLVKASNI